MEPEQLQIIMAMLDCVPGICCFMTVDTVIPLTSIRGQGKYPLVPLPRLVSCL